MADENLVWAVGEMAELATAEFQVEDMLRRLCEVAAKALKVDGACVMLTESGQTRFVHASAPPYADLGAVQELFQSGPCLSALASGKVVAASSPAEMQWPEFESVAAVQAVRAVLAVPLISRATGWGSLDLYWRENHQISGGELASAKVLANVAVSYIVMAADRARANEAQDRLAERVLHDQLTGLPNRGLILELIEHALVITARRKTRTAVLFVDLDQFKPINDNFGHQVGDQVLKHVAAGITQHLGPADSAGRLGGDEFLILCEDLPPDENAATLYVNTLADRIRSHIEMPIPVADSQVWVTASIGVALTGSSGWPVDGTDLVHRADTAMYEAKHTGRNRTVLIHYIDEAFTSRRSLERYLVGALDRAELAVYYQPIVSKHGQIIAVESLLRWVHPQLGLLPASQFIHIAESTGLIIPIGHWTIDQALSQLRRWRTESPGTAPHLLFCNLSPREILDPGLPAAIADSLRRHGLAPEDLGLEIVEEDLADPRLAAVLGNLQADGHPLAVDDFGTGYSSLYRLIELPVAYVKIDRSLVTRLPEDARSRTMIKAVLTVANELELDVISEGIETEPQAEYLISAGTDLLQGYFYSRPMPADRFAELLAADGGIATLRTERTSEGSTSEITPSGS